jgi:hypothetical protein
MFGRGVFAAGRTFDASVAVEAVVVARHDAVKHGFFVLPRSAGVVVDDVHADAQAGRVQALHHAPEFAYAHAPVAGIAGIAALRRRVVQRLVAPVVAVARVGRGDQRLLRLAVGRAIRCRRHAAGFRNRGDVEHGQQVDIGHAGTGQRTQVAHAIGVVIGEGEVFAAVLGRNAGVADREIAQVQLVDLHVGRGGDRGRAAIGIPAIGLDVHRIERADPAAPRIGIEAQAVGIGDPVAHDADAAHEDIDQVGVVIVRVIALQACRPDSTCRIALQRLQRSRIGLVMQAQRDLPRAGRPQREAGRVRGHGDAERLAFGRFGIPRVERGGDLHMGGIDQAILRIDLGEHQLPAQEFIQFGLPIAGQLQFNAGTEIAVAFRGLLGQGTTGDLEIEHAVGAFDWLPVVDPHAGIGRGIQAIAALRRFARPAQAPRIEPGRARVVRRGGTGVENRLPVRLEAIGSRRRLRTDGRSNQPSRQRQLQEHAHAQAGSPTGRAPAPQRSTRATTTRVEARVIAIRWM